MVKPLDILESSPPEDSLNIKVLSPTMCINLCSNLPVI